MISYNNLTDMWKDWVKIPHWSATVRVGMLVWFGITYETRRRIFMEKIIKRDGKIVEFDSAKITDAITKASNATKEIDKHTAQQLTRNVLNIIKNFVREKQSNFCFKNYF